MDWFETAIEPELFEKSEKPEERYLLFCILSGKKSGECRINEFLYLIQNRLNEIDSKGKVLFHKAFVYGDVGVCIRNFSETEDREIYYVDACSEPVPDSHLMIIADSCAGDRARKYPFSAMPVWLLIISESEYGTGRLDELTLKNYFSKKEIPYHLVMAGSRSHGDWLEKFVEKQDGRTFSFEEAEELADYITGS